MLGFLNTYEESISIEEEESFRTKSLCPFLKKNFFINLRTKEKAGELEMFVLIFLNKEPCGQIVLVSEE